MIRLAAAGFIAVCVHAALFLIEVPWTRPILIQPQSRTVSLDLVTFKPPVEEPVQPKPKKVKPRSKPKAVPKPVIESPSKIPSAPQAPLPDTAEAAEMPESIPESKEAILEPVGAEKKRSDHNPDDQATVQASVPLYHLNPPPNYPRVARRRQYQGTVILDVNVAVDGSAVEVRIAQSSGYAILDNSAVKSVKKWRFTPARRGGQPFEMWVKVPVRYELR